LEVRIVRVSLWIVLAVVAAGFAVAGCGDDEENGGGGGGQAGTEEQTEPSEAASQTVDISATDFKFDPANPSVKKAGVVQFRLTNDGQTSHALEVEGPGGEVETDVIQPGESATLKADLSRRGSFVIYCPVGNHRELGMEGEVRVAGGGAGARDDEGGPGRDGEKGGNGPGDDSSKDGAGDEDSGGGGGSYGY
jgi:uncharacterized cupredoxin-like copper-binding protein